MTVDKLKRVMWRIRSRNPGKDRIKRMELARAIMLECGTTRMTIWNNTRALVELGWIRKHRGSYNLTGKDIED